MKIYHFFIDSILSFIFSFVKPCPKTIVFNSSFNTNFNFNSKFLFEYLIKDKKFKHCQIYFVMNDESKRNELNEIFHGRFISTKELRGKLIALKASLWITSTIETPLFGFAKNKKRFVYHLGHGIPLKNIGLAENNLSLLRWINRKARLRLFTHVTCYSDFFEVFFLKVFGDESISLVKLGQPRNDSLLNSEELGLFLSEFNIKRKNILYSPTWRPYAKTKFFPFKEFSVRKLHQTLERNNTVLYLREHPYNKAVYPDGVFDSEYVVRLNSDILQEITPFLNSFDMLITDYSSIYLDFLTLRKPVLYLPYDIVQYEKEVGFSLPFDSLVYGAECYSEEAFLRALDAMPVGEFRSSDLDAFLKKINLRASGNCSDHRDYISSLLNLSSCE
ncbi:CDP-glycerol glycerophosphotransferase family protein [Vibrio harveyi]